MEFWWIELDKPIGEVFCRVPGIEDKATPWNGIEWDGLCKKLHGGVCVGTPMEQDARYGYVRF